MTEESKGNGEQKPAEAYKLTYRCTRFQAHTIEVTVTVQQGQPAVQLPIFACNRCHGLPIMQAGQPEAIERSRIVTAVPRPAAGGIIP